MFDKEIKEPRVPKKPTLRQWLKTIPKKKKLGAYFIELIWLPDTFDLITLTTSAFRINVPKGAEPYEDLLGYFRDIDIEPISPGIQAVPSERRDGSFTLTKSALKGNYTAFGPNGIKWEYPDDSGA
jgi:hypothetical protein